MRFYTNARSYGNKILCRWHENGTDYMRKIDFHPTLYIPSNVPTKYKTLYDQFVKEIRPGTINDCKEFIEKYKDVDNFKIYGNTKWQYQFIAEEYPEEEIEWDIDKIKVAAIDIETDSSAGMPNTELANRAIISIAYKINGTCWVYGTREFVTDRTDVRYVKCRDEMEILSCFINKWASCYPDIITGWNTEFFDIPYLVNRIIQIFGETEAKRLSPWNLISKREVKGNYGKTYSTYDLIGISHIDYLNAYKKFTYVTRPTYKLDYIGQVELDEKKVDYKSAGYKSLDDLYRRNHQLFIEYNIQDVDIVMKLEDKMRLLELVMTLSYMCKINFEDAFFQVRMWDTLIYNNLLAKGVVIPQQEKRGKESKYEGAYVKEPRAGMYKYVASFDLASLYPHLIMQYNISPETFVEWTRLPKELKELLSDGVCVDSLLSRKHDLSDLKRFGVTITPNCQFFKTDKQGFLPEMMEKFYAARSAYKKKMLAAEKELQTCTDPERKKELKKIKSRYDLLQLGVKVTLNSAYGALGNEHFRFFDTRYAMAITTAGQLSIRWAQEGVDAYLNKLAKTEGKEYVIYVDTDSNYVCLDEFVKRAFPNGVSDEDAIKFMDRLCNEKIQPFIEKRYGELAEYTNAFAQKMQMKREVLADKGIWTAKKRYVLNVHNSEGVQYAKPKMKIMGLETVKSSTPDYCRNALGKAIEIIMTSTEDDLISYIKKCREEFNTLPVNDISFPRSVNGITKYHTDSGIFQPSTPIHVRGALTYNKTLVEHGLNRDNPKVNDGDKIRFVYLIEPNPIKQNVISYPDSLPEEFGLDKYIDRELQFQKSFVEPLKAILDCIGWSTEKKSTLSKFKRKQP